MTFKPIGENLTKTEWKELFETLAKERREDVAPVLEGLTEIFNYSFRFGKDGILAEFAEFLKQKRQKEREAAYAEMEVTLSDQDHLV